MPIFEPVLEALNQGEVRYVVVGGVAVVLHGYARLTADLDLAVDLGREQAERAIDALTGIGLVPTAPVDPKGFADPNVRATWSSEKGMKVFSMRDPSDPLRVVDLFVENPMDFEGLWQRSEIMEVGSTIARIASLHDLIEMKRQVGRPQDLQDIEALEEIRRRRKNG